MSKYEKPMTIADSDVAEGVFMSSGATGGGGGDTGTGGATDGGGGDSSTSSGAKCMSVYIKGNYIATDGNAIANGGTNLQARGCEGCPANWGHCAVAAGEINYTGDFRPSWEVQGKDPNGLANS